MFPIRETYTTEDRLIERLSLKRLMETATKISKIYLLYL